MSISAIIVDDEQHCIDALRFRLEQNCPDVDIISTSHSVAEAEAALRRLRPALVFLDINLPDGTGFTLLEKVLRPDFQVIFTTAYDEFAIKAFKFNAVDYLLKPINDDDVRSAVDRFRRRNVDSNAFGHLQRMLDEVKRTTEGIHKIALPTAHGHTFVMLNDIIRLQSDSNYTTFHLKDKSKIVVAKTLKEYEELLQDLPFIRIHNSDMINLAFVKEYSKGNGGTVLLTDGTELEVAARRKPLFLDSLARLLKL